MVKSFFKVSKKTAAPASKPKFLEGITVKNAKGDPVVVSDLWKRTTVILKVLRRFGCPLCRYESRLLSELKPELDALGIKLAAVGFEDVGLSDFLAGGYWDWDILIDTERSVHKALNLPKLPVSAGLKDLMSAATRSAIAAAQKAGITGDLKGDGFQLGGTFVVEKVTGELLYDFKQVGAGSYCSLKEIYEACGGDPDDIDEKAPEDCIAYTKKVCTIGGECFKD
ncbi:hypothetical protein DSO57_1004625 [Entomophthora muscae]|uniref:Uncharacterized protein n=2 Tax=Entomophthora muscae TaxID=34485 RepID=A0ACC2SKW9_9FUNG|nr:hypothetical protein DSO57_1018733 [Entomophthora muscae]KAJ9062993.1 hypothetical protein DSO57_1004625 [Entomophthora muscae]